MNATTAITFPLPVLVSSNETLLVRCDKPRENERGEWMAWDILLAMAAQTMEHNHHFDDQLGGYCFDDSDVIVTVLNGLESGELPVTTLANSLIQLFYGARGGIETWRKELRRFRQMHVQSVGRNPPAH